jgi:peptide/nickel transport system permease protein
MLVRASPAVTSTSGETALRPPQGQVALPARRPSVYLVGLRGILRDPFALTAVATLVVVLLAALTAPVLAPYDPADQNLAARLRPPAWYERGSFNHLLGTDQLGRDILSRIIYGARVSSTVGLSVILLGGIVGTGVGLCAGFFGGRLETVIVAVIDVVLSFPSLLLALTIVAVLGPNITTLVLALSLRGWVVYARMARGQALALSQFQFVEAARSIGAPSTWILARHLLPNLLPSIMTIAVLELARVVLAESSLSFLGLGVQPPTPAWGTMLAEGREVFRIAWWTAVFPGLAILITVLGVNLLGDGLDAGW